MNDLLQQALDATHPGHSIDTEKVRDWLRGRDADVTVDYAKQYKRDAEARKAREKEIGALRFARAVIYKGNLKHCWQVKAPTRGASYFCGNKPTRVVRDSTHKYPMVVCAGCAHRTHNEAYTGWGGDPNKQYPLPHQRLGTIEPEYIALLERSEADDGDG